MSRLISLKVVVVMAVTLALTACGKDQSDLAVGTTLECPSSTPGKSFFAVIGYLEPYSKGHDAALITIDDPSGKLFRGLDMMAIDADVLKRGCPKKSSISKSLAPGFAEAVKSWREEVAKGQAGLDTQGLPDAYEGSAYWPPPVGHLQEGKPHWGLYAFCEPDASKPDGCLRK